MVNVLTEAPPDVSVVHSKPNGQNGQNGQNEHFTNYGDVPTKNAPMRILMVTPRYFPEMGGTETHVYEVARRIAALGHDVTVLTTDRQGQWAADERVNGVRILRVRAWPANKDYYFAPHVYSAIIREHWDVIHCQGYHTLVPPIAMLAAQHSHTPYLVTFHSGGHSSDFRHSIRDVQTAVLRPLLTGAAQLIGVSRFEAEIFQRRLGVPAERFVVIPNGSHLPQVTAPPQTEKMDSKQTLILSVGRLERYKGHQRMIAALPKILESYPNAQLRILGTGPYKVDLRSMVAALGLEQHVTIGAVPIDDRQGMAAMLSQATLVTLLSDYEAHPVAVMEALSLRRPVLVTATSGLQELADKGWVRSIALESTPEQVAQAVLEQLRDPLRPPENIELPTWDTCAASLVSVYQKVLHKHAAAGQAAQAVQTMQAS